MENGQRILLSLILLVFLIIVFYYGSAWITKTTGYASAEEEKSNLALCLAEKKAVIYGDNESLKEQKEILGEAFKYVNFVDCDKNVITCRNLPSLPAWKINGFVYLGVKDFDVLKILARC